MQTIYLDISNKGAIPTIYAKQGDVGRKFKAFITDGGLKYPLSRTTFSAGYEGASGSGNYEEIYGESAFEIMENTVVVELASNMFQVPGDSIFCLTMKDGNSSVIGLWNIPVYTEKTPGFLSDPIGDYYPSLSAVLYKEQKLTTEQQEQARYNIGAIDVSTVLNAVGDMTKTLVKSVNGMKPNAETGNVDIAPDFRSISYGSHNWNAEDISLEARPVFCLYPDEDLRPRWLNLISVNPDPVEVIFGGCYDDKIITCRYAWDTDWTVSIKTLGEAESNVFIGTIETPLTEYVKAYSDGKVCYLKYRNEAYLVSYACSDWAAFSHISPGGSIEYGTLRENGEFSFSSFGKVNWITSDLGDDLVPSAKAVYDAIIENNKTVVGVDTVTWDGNTDGLMSFVDEYEGETFYKLSDSIPTKEEIKVSVTKHLAGLRIFTYEGEDNAIVPDVTEEPYLAIADVDGTDCVIVILQAGVRGATEPGIYFVKRTETDYVQSITIDKRFAKNKKYVDDLVGDSVEELVFVGDENTTLAEYAEAYSAGKACFMRRNSGGSGRVTWTAYNAHSGSASFYTITGGGEILYGMLLPDGGFNYSSVNLGNIETALDAIIAIQNQLIGGEGV